MTKPVQKLMIQIEPLNRMTVEDFYSKDEKIFSILYSISEATLIVDHKTLLKGYSVSKGIVFGCEGVKLIKGGERIKKELRFSSSMTDRDKKEIQKEYGGTKSGTVFLSYDSGWDKDWDQTQHFFSGKVTHKIVPCHKLQLQTPEYHFGFKILSKKEKDDLVKNGMSSSKLEDVKDGCSEGGAVFDEGYTFLSVDEQEIESFYSKIKPLYIKAVKEYKKTHKNKPPEKEKKPVKKYAFIFGEWIKRSYYCLTIYEPFDFSKLSFSIGIDTDFEGKPSESFSLMYDDIEFEFDSNDGTNANDYKLVSSAGEVFDFDVNEDGEDYDDGEDSEDD